MKTRHNPSATRIKSRHRATGFGYLFVLDRRGGGDPALDLVRDPHLIVAGAGWLGLTLALLRNAPS